MFTSCHYVPEAASVSTLVVDGNTLNITILLVLNQQVQLRSEAVWLFNSAWWKEQRGREFSSKNLKRYLSAFIAWDDAKLLYII